MCVALDTMESVVFAEGLLPVGSRGLVAVSGGRDSMVLLHALSRWRDRGRWELVVASMDHGLRGEAGAADVAFVKETSATLGLDFCSDRKDVLALRKPRESLEAVARQVRHAFLARVARERGCQWVALGHHAGDQAELFLMRLLRGSGAEGLSGMRAQCPSPADPGVRLVRPLLGLPSKAIAALAEAWGLEWREDASNTDTQFLRNRVRHQLLPLLEGQLQPAVEEVLGRVQTVLRDQAEWMRSEAIAWVQRRSVGIAERFEELPVAMQREVIRVQAKEVGADLEFSDVESLRKVGDGSCLLEGGKRLRRMDDGSLQFVELAPGENEFLEGWLDVEMEGEAGDVLFGGGRLRWRRIRGAVCRNSELEGDWSRGERLDAACVGKRVRLRHWRPGDRFCPIGLGASAKLQDLFTNARIPAPERRKRVLGENELGELFWVEGLRIAEAAKITGATAQTVVWFWERE